MADLSERYQHMKDFPAFYQREGAYHHQASGFRSWFLEDNYRAIAAACAPDDVVLDLACGEGCLARHLRVSRLAGVDYVPRALELCRELNPDRYHELLVGDLRQLDLLDLPRPGFSVVTCSLSLMYVAREDLPATLAEIRRLLHRAGRFVFTYPTVSRYRSPNPTADELPPHELQACLLETGFREVVMEPFCPLVDPEVVRSSEDPAAAPRAREVYVAARTTMTLERCYHWCGQAVAP